MNAPEKMSRVVDGVRYSVQTATLIADNTWWDGRNHERSGRNTFLYRGKSGRFFFVHLTQWQGESDHIAPCTIEEAAEFFTGTRDSRQYFEFEEAFPSLQVEEA